MNQWVNESMNQWIKESTVIEPMKQGWWFSESKNQWVSQWILEPMNQWISDAMHIDFMSQSTNESMNGWISEAMNEGTNEWHLLATPLSYSYFFSERPLIWAASALNCLPAPSSAASATQFFPLRSQHGRFCNLQLQFKKENVKASNIININASTKIKGKKEGRQEGSKQAREEGRKVLRMLALSLSEIVTVLCVLLYATHTCYLQPRN